MHSLTDLKNLFEKNGIKIKSFGGWRLTTYKLGVWSMVDDVYRHNSVPIERSEIKKMIEKHCMKSKRPKDK